MNPIIKPPPILYGIGITDEYVEIMSIKNRDNNAILHQMMQSMEERINKRIDNVRNEILGKIDIDDDHDNYDHDKVNYE